MEVSFEDIKKANETIKTTDVKGKAYAEVNQRIKAFRMVYPTGFIKTEIVDIQNGMCVMRAEVGIISEDETHILGTGTAYEKEGSSFINKTSYIENCETSAIGRALGMAGFGIDTSVASFEEVANAIQQQDDEKVIDKTKAQALDKSIENAGIKDEVVELILSGYGYTSTSEIKVKDYNSIIEDLKSKKE